MSMGTKASDWQVCSISEVAAADVVGGGLFAFDFYSATAGLTARFAFKGLGAGIGGDASGVVLPQDFGNIASPWSSIKCDNAFSAWDLNGAWGRITQLGAGIAVSYTVMLITAAPAWSWSRSWFNGQNVGGFGIGTSAGGGGFVFAGNWRFKHVSNNQPGDISGQYVA